MARDLKYGFVAIEGVPDDEPVFVLRAQDQCSVATIAAYSAICETVDAPRGHVESIRIAALEFEAWQLQYTSKVPD